MNVDSAGVKIELEIRAPKPFVTDNTQKLIDHAETLRAAFLFTDAELREIFAALSLDADTPLTLDIISAVYRRGWLTRKLKLSVREFLLLTQYMGLDPFVALDPVDPPILRLIEFVTRLRTVSLKPTEALYLIWNQDISGQSAPDNAEISRFACTLRTDLTAIESEFAEVDNSDGEIAQAKMALVYGADTANLFFGLLDKNVVTDVEYSHGQATLQPPILNAATEEISYDNLGKRLAYSAGVMPDSTRDALKAVAGVTQAFKNAVDQIHQKSRVFFVNYPELLARYNDYIASNETPERKWADLLENFLPKLKQRRKRQHAMQAISAVAKTDIGFATTILDDVNVLHAAGDNGRPALYDLEALGTPGLAANFYFRDTATGAVNHSSDAESNLNYSPTGSNTLPDNGGNPVSGIWSGYIEAPENSFYNLRIEADSGAEVSLTLDGVTNSLAQDGNVWSNDTAIELQAGTFYAIALTVENLKNKLNVRWETPERRWEVIPSRYLYPARQGGTSLKEKAEGQIKELVEDANSTGLFQLFSLRQDFSNEWHKFVTSDSNENFKATIKKEYFSYIAQGLGIGIDQIQLLSIKDRNIEAVDSSSIVDNTLDQINDDGEGEIEIIENKLDKEAQVFIVLRYTIT